MAVERKIDFWIDRLGIEWHAMGKTKYLPVLINYVLTPLSVWLYSQINSEFYLDYLEEQLVFLVPLFSVWWSLLIMYQYVEGNGRELLYIDRSSRAISVFFYYVLYIFSIIPILLYIMNHMPRAVIILPKLLSQSFMFSGIIYMMGILTDSISYGFILIFAFSLFSGNRLDKLLRGFGIEPVQSSLGYVVIGIICFAGGIIMEKNCENKY